MITLVDRQSRFTMILALPQGRSADHVADVLIDYVQGLPALARKSLTWDQGTEMGRHAAVTVATDLPVFFADVHSPWQRPTNETPPAATRPGGAPEAPRGRWKTARSRSISPTPRPGPTR